MAKFKLQIGKAIPAGPMRGGIPRGPGAQHHPAQTRAPRDHRSKKAYTGTVAGLGRTPAGTRIGSGPAGPRRFGGSVSLPARATGPGVAAAVQFRPAPPKPPSLMTRIGQRLRRGAAALGL